MVDHYRVQVNFPHVTGPPADTIVHTWACKAVGAATPDAVADDFAGGLTLFYTAIKSFLSSQYKWDTGEAEFIRLEDDKPRYPVETRLVTVGTKSTTNYDWPPEVALCLSFRGVQTSGLNMARRRGRVFLGPLQGSSDDWPTAAGSYRSTIVAAGADLRDDLTDSIWCVYSRHTHYGVPVGGNIKDYSEVPANLDASFVPVTVVWADDAWDTQRRRGTPASGRVTDSV